MIKIKQSKTADTRTCDYKNVSKEQLLESSYQHIGDVKKGLLYLVTRLVDVACNHDSTKISGIDQFHSDFISGFKTTSWWDKHRQQERHHLSSGDGVPEDVDLIDVLEFLVDGVMAGLGRSGQYRKEKLPEGLLERALNNTVTKLIEEVEVEQ